MGQQIATISYKLIIVLRQKKPSNFEAKVVVQCVRCHLQHLYPINWKFRCSISNPTCVGRQLMMNQIFESLPLMWKTKMKFLFPAFSLVCPCLLQPFGEEWIEDIFVCLSLPLFFK